MTFRPNVVVEAFTRPEPHLTPRTGAFWTSGADGLLRLACCNDCGLWMHPPQPVCRSCRSLSVGQKAVSGRGVIHAFTINRYAWTDVIQPPYVIAEVMLEDADQIVLLTSIVDCNSEEVHIGMTVEVCFAASGESFIPLFRPVSP